MKQFLTILCLFATGLMSGCTDSHQRPSPDVTPWDVTALRQERSHDIVESEDENLYHVNFLAVEMKKNGTTVNLLYEDELPPDWDLRVGDHCRIDGLDSAEYCEEWHGYWLHEVRVHQVFIPSD